MAEQGDQDASSCEDGRRAYPHGFEELAAMVTCGRGALQSQHLVVELPLVDCSWRYAVRATRVGGDASHGLVIRSPKSFFHSS